MAEINEINELDLEQASGGVKATLGSKPISGKMPINLTGGYWAASDMTGGFHTLAVGWPNLFVVQYSAGKAPFLIYQGNGVIGWTVAGNFTYRYN